MNQRKTKKKQKEIEKMSKKCNQFKEKKKKKKPWNFVGANKRQDTKNEYEKQSFFHFCKQYLLFEYKKIKKFSRKSS